MTKSELTANLKEWELEHLYSLDGSLEPDKYILYHNYSVWEYFFFDEKGGRSNMRFFHSYNRENETYNFLKRNVQFSLFFHPIKAKAFNHHLSGN